MYLFKLADRVARGLRQIDPSRIVRHREFLMAHQLPDGGFRGREGGSDLYYTGFAVRALAVTGELEPQVCQGLKPFLDSFQPLDLGAIDLLSWLYCVLVLQAATGHDILASQPEDLSSQLCRQLELRRVADGGYTKSSGGAAGSTYQSFMVALTYELLGQSVPRRNALVQFLYDRQRDDGGFVEIAPMKRSGTNPTAAAVALLNKLNAMDNEIADDALAFLTDVISSEGGFQANTRVPFADGLSTFTALLTAQDLGRRDLISPDKIVDWVSQSIELPSGGFRGASWDQQADVEYTFYGLGILGLLHAV
ncbi:MAG: terpene cyclase/mutase family protein [Planctomycetaceae bacterium]|nr:terpene cyclase/mutase family protein [Planctomycetaceae bacterium]